MHKHKTVIKEALMTLVKLKRHHQITVPSALCKKFNLGVGDYMEIEDHDDKIVIKPVKMVHPDQAYFYTKEWQKGEAEVDQELAKGEVVGPFDNIKDALKALKKAKI